MKATITAALQQHLNNSPLKTKVWLNDAGDWSNHKDPKYPHEVTRAEALKAKPGAVVKDIADAGKEAKTDAGTADAGKTEDPGTGADGKNTTDLKIQVKVTAKNKKDFPPGAKVGDMVEVDNPDYVDPLL